MRKNIQNILLISLSNIGDVVMSLPVANVLRGNFPDADLSIVTGPKVKGLLKDNAVLKEVFIYDKHWSLRDKIRFVLMLRRQRYDLVIDLKNSLIPFLVGAPLHSSPLEHLKKHQGKVVDKHLRALNFLHLDHSKRIPIPLYTDEDKKTMQEKCQHAGVDPAQLSNAIVMAPGARSSFKLWPKEKYADLCRLICEQDSQQLIIVAGVESEKKLTSYIVSSVSGKIFDCAGLFSMHEFLALLDSVKVLVGNDSGAMHMAHYQDNMVITLFGPTDSGPVGRDTDRSAIIKRTDLPCVPCRGFSCDIGRVCLEDLEAERVFHCLSERGLIA